MALNEPEPRDPRLERLYRDAAREEPPAHLDAAILAAARREAGARPRPLASTLRRWHVPVSIAAVVVVSASLVILVREEGGERIGETRIPPVAAPAERSDAALEQRLSAAVEKHAAQAEAETAAGAAPRDRRDDSTGRRARNTLEDGIRHESDSAAPSKAGAAASKAVAEPSPEPFRASRPGPAQERAQAPASPEAVAGPGLGADSRDPFEPRAAAPATVEKRTDAPAADALAERRMASALAAKPATQDRTPVWKGFEKEPPEKWLKRIEELMREGRSTEAEEMKSEFRRRFPEHPQARGMK